MVPVPQQWTVHPCSPSSHSGNLLHEWVGQCFLLSFVRSRIAIFGKSVFYFGFVFFSLNLISSALEPLRNEPALTNYLIQPQNPLVAILVRKLSGQTLSLFDDIRRQLVDGSRLDVSARAKELQDMLGEINRELLPLLARPDRSDAGTLSNFATYSRRLTDKLVSFASLQDNEPMVSDEYGR